MLRVGVGVTAMLKGIASDTLDGIGYYSKYLLERLTKCSSICHTPVLFGSIKGINFDHYPDVLRLRDFTSSIAISSIFRLPFFDSEMIKERFDVFHSTDHRIPFFRNTPCVATIHDAIPFSNPEWASFKHNYLISPVFRNSAKRADRIITVSQYSKLRISEFFNISVNQIKVIPNGVDERWFKGVDSDRLNFLINRHGLSDRYVIAVGTLQPRKNIERLIYAYAALPEGVRNCYDLVVVGRAGSGCEAVVRLLNDSALNSRVRWLRYLPAADLEALVKGAACLAFPSLSEGFGLPVVEAFAAGTPVLTSNTTALPEVAGDAALLVDPTDIEAISDGLRAILDHPQVAADLRFRGSRRALLYSWDKVAKDTVGVYESLV